MEQTEHKLTILTQGTASTWRAVAEQLGFRILRGPQAGLGNISAVFNGIAQGTITPEELGAALTKVRVHEEAAVGST